METTQKELVKEGSEKPKKGSGVKLGVTFFIVLILLGGVYLVLKKGEVQSNQIGLLVTKRGFTSEVEIRHGLVFGKPISRLIVFPLSAQTVQQKKADSNQISFRSKDGILLKVDTYFEVSIVPHRILDFYKKYNTTFETVINDQFSLNIRDEFVFKASTMVADSILNNQEFFITEIEGKCRKLADENFFQLNKLGYLSPIEIPKELQKVVADIIFSKELTEKARIDKNRVLYELELNEAKNKQLLDSVVTSNLVRMHTQMTNNELRINQFRTDSNVYAVKYNPQILEAMRIDNYTKAIEKWNGALPSSQAQSLTFPFDNSANKVANETTKYKMKDDSVSK